MRGFYKDLAKVLENHNVAIVARVNECGYSEIGFQNMLAECSYTGRHHFTAYECGFAGEFKLNPLHEAAPKMYAMLDKLKRELESIDAEYNNPELNNLLAEARGEL